RSLDSNIAATKAELLPKITLSATGSRQFDPAEWVGSLLAGLTQPVFQGGRLRAQVELAEAQKQEAAEHYVQTMLTAVKEVEDALSALSTAEKRRAFYGEAAEEAEKAYAIAQMQFKEGSIDFQTLLDTQRSQLA